MIIKLTRKSTAGKGGFFTRALDKFLDHKARGSIRKRKRTIRPSEIGYCLRNIVMSILNLLPEDVVEPRIQRIFDNGNSVHTRYLRGYLKFLDCRPLDVEVEKDGKMEWVECVEQRFEDKELWLKGSPDAIIHNPEDGLDYIFELKSIKQEQFNKLNGPLIEHIYQAYVYMHMTGIPRALILYENKNTQEIKEFIVTRDEKLMIEVLNKIKSVIKYVTEYETTRALPPKCHDRYCGACKLA